MFTALPGNTTHPQPINQAGLLSIAQLLRAEDLVANILQLVLQAIRKIFADKGVSTGRDSSCSKSTYASVTQALTMSFMGSVSP